VLARCRPDARIADVTHRIHERTGLLALSKREFIRMTMSYYLLHTGIPINFGTTVLLGFLIGCAIAGQTFYLFTIENLKQFGTLKAMGLSDRALVGMILLQALLVAGIGYGLGIGVATVFGMFAARQLPLLSFYLPWQVLATTGIAMILIALLSSVLSIRRVLVLEPAIVFQGG
jgi:putative ABC transport system permease protein